MSPKANPDVKINGKVVIVTGSNCGIGYETALDLAQRGGTVIVACRDLTKANEAATKIIDQTKSEQVHVIQLDLASLESIREFATAFKAKFSRLDILINNAGLSGIPFQKTKDDFEMQIGVMHFGHFYLTFLLFDVLKKSAPSRIINVSSYAHTNGKIDWESFKSDKGYSGFRAYCQAKLANVLFTRELADRYGKDGVTSVSLHPGVVQTEIWRQFKGKKNVTSFLFSAFSPLFNALSKDCKDGAQTTIHCAIDDKIPEQNGQYFDNCKVAKMSKAAQDKELARKLWEISETELKIKFN